LTIDPTLPFVAVPSSNGEAYVVQASAASGPVEVSLSRTKRQKHLLASESYTPLELLALRRFRRSDITGYTTYAGRLEHAARLAARGELGYTVYTSVDDGVLRVCMVARLLDADGHLQTELSHESRFEDPDSDLTLVQSNEKAAELRASAAELNDEWASANAAQLAELRAQYDRDDAQAQAAENLRRIIEDEGR
jgi:hypothetical protein